LRILLFLGTASAGGWAWYTYAYLPEQRLLARAEAATQRMEALARKGRPCTEAARAASERCAALLREAGKGVEALAEYRKALGAEHPELARKLDTALIQGHALLAESLRHLDPERALASYGQLRRLDPQNGRWYARTALLLTARKEYRRAVEFARLATQLAPDTWQAYRDYGQVLEKAQRLREAARAYRRAAELAPLEEQAGLRQRAHRLAAAKEG